MTSRMCGVGGRSSAPNRGRSLRSGGSSAAEVVERGGDQPRRADRVASRWALWACGSHLTQSQWVRLLLGAEHRDDEVVGGVEGRGRADHRAGQPSGPSSSGRTARSGRRRAGRCDAGRLGCSRCTTRSRCSADAAAGSTWSIGRALRRDQLERQRLRAEAVAHVQEVGVARTVLPHAGALLGQRGQRGRLGVVPGQRPALLVGGVAGDLADVGEVAEVLGARAGDLLRALLPLPVDLHDDEAERGEEEHAGGDEAAGRGCRRRPWSRPARSSRGCRASGWRSSGRRWRPRSPGSPAAAAGRSGRPGISGSSSRCPPRSVVLTRVPP